MKEGTEPSFFSISSVLRSQQSQAEEEEEDLGWLVIISAINCNQFLPTPSFHLGSLNLSSTTIQNNNNNN